MSTRAIRFLMKRAIYPKWFDLPLLKDRQGQDRIGRTGSRYGQRRGRECAGSRRPAGDGVVGLMVAGPLRPLHHRIPSPAPWYQPLRPLFTPGKSILLSLTPSQILTHSPNLSHSLYLLLWTLPSSFLPCGFYPEYFFSIVLHSGVVFSDAVSSPSSGSCTRAVRLRFPTGAHPLNSHSFVTVPDCRCDGRASE